MQNMNQIMVDVRKSEKKKFNNELTWLRYIYYKFIHQKLSQIKLNKEQIFNTYEQNLCGANRAFKEALRS